MRCPYCNSLDTQVKDSRPTDDNTAIRRRRICSDCGGRFTTFERVQLRELTVVKRSGRRVPFERDKLARSVEVALRKRPVDRERVERMLTGLVRRLESQGESDIPSELIGEMVMEGLKQIDGVAYVRFASVYRDFREARDFENALAELGAEDEPSAAPSPAPAEEGHPSRPGRKSDDAASAAHASGAGHLAEEDERFMVEALNVGAPIWAVHRPTRPLALWWCIMVRAGRRLSVPPPPRPQAAPMPSHWPLRRQEMPPEAPRFT